MSLDSGRETSSSDNIFASNVRRVVRSQKRSQTGHFFWFSVSIEAKYQNPFQHHYSHKKKQHIHKNWWIPDEWAIGFHEFRYSLIADDLMNDCNKKRVRIFNRIEFEKEFITTSPNRVSIKPGQMQLTRTPLSPNSMAISLVKPRRAVLLRPYAPMNSI